MATTEVALKVELVGVGKLIEGLNRAMQDLRPHRDRLVQMGWTDEMADNFLGDISEIIARELFKDLEVRRVGGIGS